MLVRYHSPIRKIATILFGFLFAILIGKRFVIITLYTAGNIELLDAYHATSETTRNENLIKAREAFVKVAPYAFAGQAPLWHLSDINFLLKEYDKAADWMQLARLNERLDFLLTPEVADYYVLDAILHSRNGAWEEAITNYRTAMALEPKEWDSTLYQRYYEALLHSEQAEYQAVVSLILAASSRSEAIGAGAPFDEGMTDWLSILEDKQSSECWLLAQIQYSPIALELGPLVPVNLLWNNIKNDDPYLESKLVVNLVPNGGFEWGSAETGQPVGYPRTIYDEDNLAENHRLVTREALQADVSTVAVLENSSTFYNSSFVTRPIEINAEKLYVQGGWLKEVNGNGSLGLGWYGRLLDGKNPYHFLRATETTTQWLFYGEVVSLPKNIESIDLTLTNYNSEGRVYFDDLFLFEMEAPSC